MRATVALRVIGVVAAVALAGACARAAAPAGMAFRSFTIEGQSLQGQLEGPWEWTGGVTVKGFDLTMTVDRLRLWPTPDGRDAERIEASGNVRLEGRYLAPDKALWEISGKADAGTYEKSNAQAVLRGSVSFRARNPATGAVLTAAAEKLVYDVRTRRFRFERGDQPVRIEWSEPLPEEQPAAQPGQLP